MVRELGALVSAVLVALYVFIVVVFIDHLRRTLPRPLRLTTMIRLVRASWELQGAVALLVFFLGATTTRAAALYLWNFGADDRAVAAALVGLSISIVGALCIIRVFASERYRRSLLAGAVLSASTLAAASLLM